MVTLARRIMPNGHVLFDIVQLLTAMVIVSAIAALRSVPRKLNMGWRQLADERPGHGERDYGRAP
jgi:hypothetical protein